jgi:elongation factor 1-beta
MTTLQSQLIAPLMRQTQNLVGRVFHGVRLTCYSYGPSQADVVSYKAFKSEPPVEKYPHIYRWYRHIKSYESEFSTLPGDPSKAYTTYGPESVAVAVNPKNAPAEEEDDMDLFGSDEEEEDPEVVAEREKRLADYKKKKEGKAKPAAKSIVILDVKPWGAYSPRLTSSKRS